MKQLFPVVEVPSLSHKQKEGRRYRPSVAWDMGAGDFSRDGAMRLVRCDGVEAYKTWCHKAVNTERYMGLAYPNTLGVEFEAAFKEKTEAAVESAVERTITEALMVHPCTEYVRGFSFEWDGDRLNCEFTVNGADMEEFRMDVDVTVRGEWDDG